MPDPGGDFDRDSLLHALAGCVVMLVAVAVAIATVSMVVRCHPPKAVHEPPPANNPAGPDEERN